MKSYRVRHWSSGNKAMHGVSAAELYVFMKAVLP